MGDTIIILGLIAITILPFYMIAAFSPDEKMDSKPKYKKKPSDIYYKKIDNLKIIYLECIIELRKNLPFEIKQDSIEAKIFFSEVIFCITCLGLMYPTITEELKYSNKRNKEIGNFAIKEIKKIFNNGIDENTIMKYYGIRMIAYGAQMKALFKQLEICGINFDLDIHIDNLMQTTTKQIITELYRGDLIHYTPYNPLNSKLKEITYTYKIDTYYDKYIEQIAQSIIKFSNIIKELYL